MSETVNRKGRSAAVSIIAGVCNEHRNSDLRADNPAILLALNRRFECLELQLSAATERATKAEAGLKVSGWQKWPDEESGEYPPDDTDVLIYECGFLPDDPHFWQSFRVGFISRIRGTMGPSHAKAWKLIDRPTLLDLEMPPPNGLTSDTFASGTDWRGNE